jgi:hypothetical protein
VWCRVRSGQVPSLVAETILSAGRHRARPPRGAASAIRPARGHDPLSAGRRAAGLAETNRWAGDVLDGAVRDVAALRDLGARCAVGGANLRKSGKIGDGQHNVPVSSMRAPAGRGGAPSSSGRRRPTATGRGPDAGGARGHTLVWSMLMPILLALTGMACAGPPSSAPPCGCHKLCTPHATC